MSWNPWVITDPHHERSLREQELRRAAERARLVGHLRRPKRRPRRTD